MLGGFGELKIERIDKKTLEVLRTPNNVYFVTRYLSKELMDTIDKLAGNFDMEITVEFLVEFLKRSGENPIFTKSDAIVIPAEITEFFDRLELADKMHEYFTPLLNNANSKHRAKEICINEIRTSIDVTRSALVNLEIEIANLSDELGSVQDSWTELQKKIEALKKFISSLEKMREVFGDAFVSPTMNPSLPTISDLEREFSSLNDRMNFLQNQRSNVDIEIMQAKKSLRTLETELMNARTAEEQARLECKNIQLNIQRVKLDFSLRK
jgi:chromosome segregation ATPase